MEMEFKECTDHITCRRNWFVFFSGLSPALDISLFFLIAQTGSCLRQLIKYHRKA